MEMDVIVPVRYRLDILVQEDLGRNLFVIDIIWSKIYVVSINTCYNRVD